MKPTEGKDLGRCSKQVRGEGRWGGFNLHQCNRKGKVIIEGKIYCFIHDPIYIEKKRKQERENWDKRGKMEDDRAKFIDTAFTNCEKINPTNPLAVAEALPEMFKVCKELSYLLPIMWGDYIKDGHINLDIPERIIDLIEQVLNKLKEK